MKRDSGPGSEYAHKVHEETRSFARNLMAENEKLRALAANLQSEKLLLEEQMLAMKEELGRHEHERLRLERELADIEAQNRHYTQRYLEVEQQSSNLANLYVAAYQLHGTLDRDAVLTIIQEILANLVGSERVAIFELNKARTALELVTSSGIDAASYQTISLGEGPIGKVAQNREIFIADGAEGASWGSRKGELTACIPLTLDGRLTGAIAVFELLPQKPGIEDVDRELFELLATHAASALYCSGLCGTGAST